MMMRISTASQPESRIYQTKKEIELLRRPIKFAQCQLIKLLIVEFLNENGCENKIDYLFNSLPNMPVPSLTW